MAPPVAGTHGADAATILLELHAVWLAGHGRAARPRKPDSGHTGTIGLTVHRHRTSWNAMKPRIQCVQTHWIPGATASGRRRDPPIPPSRFGRYRVRTAAAAAISRDATARIPALGNWQPTSL